MDMVKEKVSLEQILSLLEKKELDVLGTMGFYSVEYHYLPAMNCKFLGGGVQGHLKDFALYSEDLEKFSIWSGSDTKDNTKWYSYEKVIDGVDGSIRYRVIFDTVENI